MYITLTNIIVRCIRRAIICIKVTTLSLLRQNSHNCHVVLLVSRRNLNRKSEVITHPATLFAIRSGKSNVFQMTTRIIASATVRAVKKRTLPLRAALTLTPAAVNKIKEIMSAETAKGFVGLKVGVRQRGCNGLSYTLDYAKEKNKLDEEVKQDGVTVIIDKKAQLSLLGVRIYFYSPEGPNILPDASVSCSLQTQLKGTEMDYVENKLSAEFVFNNPNIKGTCGCGESFSI